ncbi:MAG TPA: twin-arginine translocase subunit TatC [Anaerolineae bacterium]|nr:twin-arginine translocase subunit TatC [Anaerolineae bacterium]
MTRETTIPPTAEDIGMGILEHLNELRIRVMWAMGGLLIGTVIAFFFTERLFDYLVTGCNFPAIIVNPEALKAACGDIITITPTESLENFFRVAFTAGAIIAMPWMLIQLWKFIAPALHKHEKRYAYIFVPASFLLFLTGVWFAWALLLPPALVFLKTFLSDTVNISWTLDNYINFVTSFLFWLGVAFEMPLIFYFLARFGLVSPALLKDGWRFAVVGIAILAAVITPSIDPITMLLAMVPLSLLYIASILLTMIGYRQFMK